jgi:type I restriction enzyme S subunit
MKVKLGDVCIIQSGGTPSRSNLDYWKNGTISWVKISDIKDKYLNFTEEYITYEGLKNSSAKIFSKGTILYTIFATLGEVSILNIEAATNQAIAGIKLVDENVYNDFLYYYLVSKKEEVNNRGRGVAQNNINLSMLKNIEIEMPNLEKQRKIANVLDKVNKIINKRQQQLKKIDELVKSRFIEMFGDPVTNSYNLPIVSLGELSELITKGASPSWQGFSYIDDRTQTLFITSENVREGYIDLSFPKYIEDGFNDKQKRSVIHKGDFLINIVGASIGRAAQFNLDCKANMNQAAALVRINDKRIKDNYLLIYLNSEKAQRMYDLMKSDTGRANLSLKDISDLSILLPPIAQQEKFEKFFTLTNKSKLEIQKSLDKLEILKKSLMQQYFG